VNYLKDYPAYFIIYRELELIMAINDVKTKCTAMYTLLSGYLTEVAAADGYTYFELPQIY